MCVQTFWNLLSFVYLTKIEIFQWFFNIRQCIPNKWYWLIFALFDSPIFFSIFWTDHCVMGNSFDIQGPTFTIEPPHHLEFTNIVDNHVDCVAKGSPPPKIEWLHLDNTPVTTIPRVSFQLYINFINNAQCTFLNANNEITNIKQIPMEKVCYENHIQYYLDINILQISYIFGHRHIRSYTYSYNLHSIQSKPVQIIIAIVFRKHSL